MIMHREAERRKQRRREREECPVHSYQKHGKEAEELRKGVETIIRMMPPHGDELTGCDARDMVDAVRTALRELLDDTDARDSLAYLERLKPRTNKAKERT